VAIQVANFAASFERDSFSSLTFCLVLNVFFKQFLKLISSCQLSCSSISALEITKI
jgi:hypothetical protein